MRALDCAILETISFVGGELIIKKEKNKETRNEGERERGREKVKIEEGKNNEDVRCTGLCLTGWSAGRREGPLFEIIFLPFQG